jgi:hypothetical protein
MPFYQLPDCAFNACFSLTHAGEALQGLPVRRVYQNIDLPAARLTNGIVLVGG